MATYYRLFCTLLLAVLWGLPISLPAQHPLVHTYTLQDGLPMTETGNLAFDSLGYLWVASTNQQLSRYDGQQFRAYPRRQQGGYSMRQLNRFRRWVLGEEPTARQQQYYLLLGDEIRSVPLGDAGGRWVRNPFSDSLYFQTPTHLVVVDPVSLGVDTVLTNATALGTNPERYYAFFSPKQGWLSVTRNVDRTLTLQRIGTSPVPASLLRQAYRAVNQLSNGTLIAWNNDDFSPDHYGSNLRYLGTLPWATSLPPGLISMQYAYSAAEGNLLQTLVSPRSGRAGASMHYVYRIDPQRPDHLELICGYPQASKNDNYFAIDWDRGTLWAVGHTGLRRYLLGTASFPSTNPEMVGSLHAVAEAPDGTIYFAGYGTGMVRWDGRRLQRFIRPPFTSTAPLLPGHFRDADGNLLFFTESRREGGLWVIPARGAPYVYRIVNPLPEQSSLTGYNFTTVRLPATSPAAQALPETRQEPTRQFIATCLTATNYEEGRFGNIALLPDPLRPGDSSYLIGRRQGVFLTNVHAVAQDRNGRIWFGHGSTGLGIYDPVRDTAVTWRAEQAGDPGAVSMLIDDQDRLWLGSLTGLRYIDSVSTRPFEVQQHPRRYTKDCPVRDIPTNYVASLLRLGDTLVVGHTGGVSFLDLSDRSATPPVVTLPIPQYGLGASEQNALLIDQAGWLWVGADEGAVRIDYRSLLRRRPFRTGITMKDVERGSKRPEQISLVGDQGPLSEIQANTFQLPAGDRSLTFSFQLPPKKQMLGTITADAYLISARGDTLEAATMLAGGEERRQAYLPAGRYTLVTTSYENNLPRTQWTTELYIPPRLTERWWFYPGLVALLASVIILLLRTRQIRTQAALERQKLETTVATAQLDLANTQREKDRLQASTLSNAINPHFIGNAVSWLQSAYLIKRPAELIDELAENLAQTIRVMFTHSVDGRTSHGLAQELQLVSRYLRTINIQHDDRYTFHLPAEQEIARLSHYETLLMQVQVHAENAVEHGLRYRPEGRKLTITLKEQDEALHISIEDEGAGIPYVKAKQAEIGRLPGRGTAIMNQLHATFNQYNQRKLYTTVDSPIFTSENTPGYGTRITIIVPKHYRYAIDDPSGGG
ncbi:MAG: two-component regulator propeller domain-containing protein [Bacteroidota bacterium]